MEENKTNVLLLVKKDCDFAYNLRKELLKYNCEVSYINGFDELINKLMLIRSSILFFSKDTIDEFYAITKFMNTDLLKRSAVAYVGDNFDDVKEYCKNENFIYCVPNQVVSMLQNILNHYKLISHSKLMCVNNEKLNIVLNNYLTKLGFTQKWVGFKFTKECISVCVNKDFNLGSLTTDVYPYVAAKNNTTASNIERSIRNAINKAYAVTKFKNCGLEEFSSGTRKITNRLFLACLLDKVSQEEIIEEAEYA